MTREATAPGNQEPGAADENAPGETLSGPILTDSEKITVMSAKDAERITLRISLKLETMANTYETVMPLIKEAIDRRAYEALGYASLGAYAADRFGDSLTRLGLEMRRDVVRELTAAGMSTRAIAPILGVHHDTVAADRKAPVGNPTPYDFADMAAGTEAEFEIALTGARQAGDVSRKKVAEEIAKLTTPPKITGLDGRKYSRHKTTAKAAEKLRPDEIPDYLDRLRNTERLANERAAEPEFYTLDELMSEAISITNQLRKIAERWCGRRRIWDDERRALYLREVDEQSVIWRSLAITEEGIDTELAKMADKL